MIAYQGWTHGDWIRHLGDGHGLAETHRTADELRAMHDRAHHEDLIRQPHTHSDDDPPPGVPAMRQYPADPMKALPGFLAAAVDAMTAEGITESTVQRVINRLVWGHPDGYIAKPVPAEPPVRVIDDADVFGADLCRDGRGGWVTRTTLRDRRTGDLYVVPGKVVGPLIPRPEVQP